MSQKTKIEFTFGVGKDKHGNNLSLAAVAEFLPELVRYASSLFGGATLSGPNLGGWIGDAFVIEPSYTLTVITPRPIYLVRVATMIKEALLQSSVLVVETEVNSFEV